MTDTLLICAMYVVLTAGSVSIGFLISPRRLDDPSDWWGQTVAFIIVANVVTTITMMKESDVAIRPTFVVQLLLTLGMLAGARIKYMKLSEQSSHES